MHNIKTYVVSVVYLNNIAESFAARSAAKTKLNAVKAVLRFNERSNSQELLNRLDQLIVKNGVLIDYYSETMIFVEEAL